MRAPHTTTTPMLASPKNDNTMLRLLIVIFIILNLSCGRSIPKYESFSQNNSEIPDTISYHLLGIIKGHDIFVERDVNLKGGVCQLPEGMNLCQKGGIISNGTLIGNGTMITGKGAIFNKVTIKGNWNVPNISTKLFANLDEENSLRQVVALTHPNIQNTITIEEGNYQVKAEKNADVCILLCSNTNFILNGSLHLEPNNFEKSNIIQATGENIRISGKGSINGDKFTHTGKTGEWGMGINFKGAINSSVSGLTIQECWGDCIYVGGNSKDILIEDCTLNHGRRQGISVTKADGVTIKNCKITNVEGTQPQYAIDLEPNSPDSVNHILIDNVVVEDCKGGFMVMCGERKEGAKVPWIGSVEIKNCNIHANWLMPIIVNRCDSFKIEKCTIHSPKGLSAISIMKTFHAEILDNSIQVNNGIKDNVRRIARKIKNKKDGSPISISDTEQLINNNNRIID